jgi:hypothetical protein
MRVEFWMSKQTKKGKTPFQWQPKIKYIQEVHEAKCHWGLAAFMVFEKER